MSQDQNQKWTWSEDRVFEHEPTGVAAIVKRRDQGPPRYGIALMVNLQKPTETSDPYFVQYLPGTRTELPWYSVDFGEICKEVVTAAQDYIVGEIERREKEDKAAADERAARADEKKKQYLANVVARKEANRAASVAAKGKARK